MRIPLLLISAWVLPVVFGHNSAEMLVKYVNETFRETISCETAGCSLNYTATSGRNLKASNWAKGITNVLVVHLKAEDQPAVSAAVYRRGFQLTEQFFSKNSGSKQSMRFTHKFSQQVKFKAKDCQSASTCPPHGFELRSIVYREFRAGSYDRVLMAFQRNCRCVPYLGIAGIGATDAWSNENMPNQAQFAKIVTHELGHTNGAFHDGFQTQEWNNFYSVMGSGGAAAPMAHFMVSSKLAFDWLTPTQFRVLDCGRASSCAADLALYAHDTGRLTAPRLYGAAVKLGGAWFFLETRSGFKQLRRKLLLSRAKVVSGGGGYRLAGHTFLVNARAQSLGSVGIAAGTHYVLAAGSKAATVSVLGYRGGALQLRVTPGRRP